MKPSTPLLAETITVGGLSVPKQEIGVVANAAWLGDGTTSGLLGLGTPKLTAIYNGTDPYADTVGNPDFYNPFFYTAVKDKLVQKPC